MFRSFRGSTLKLLALAPMLAIIFNPLSFADAVTQTISIKAMEDSLYDPDCRFIEEQSLQNDEYYLSYFQVNCSVYGRQSSLPLGPSLKISSFQTNKQLFLKFDLSVIPESDMLTDISVDSAEVRLWAKAKENLDINLIAHVFICPNISWKEVSSSSEIFCNIPTRELIGIEQQLPNLNVNNVVKLDVTEHVKKLLSSGKSILTEIVEFVPIYQKDHFGRGNVFANLSEQEHNCLSNSRTLMDAHLVCNSSHTIMIHSRESSLTGSIPQLVITYTSTSKFDLWAIIGAISGTGGGIFGGLSFYYSRKPRGQLTRRQEKILLIDQMSLLRKGTKEMITSFAKRKELLPKISLGTTTQIDRTTVFKNVIELYEQGNRDVRILEQAGINEVCCLTRDIREYIEDLDGSAKLISTTKVINLSGQMKSSIKKVFETDVDGLNIKHQLSDNYGPLEPIANYVFPDLQRDFGKAREYFIKFRYGLQPFDTYEFTLIEDQGKAYPNIKTKEWLRIDNRYHTVYLSLRIYAPRDAKFGEWHLYEIAADGTETEIYLGAPTYDAKEGRYVIAWKTDYPDPGKDFEFRFNCS